jgi:hypothetical protein
MRGTLFRVVTPRFVKFCCSLRNSMMFVELDLGARRRVATMKLMWGAFSLVAIQ